MTVLFELFEQTILLLIIAGGLAVLFSAAVIASIAACHDVPKPKKPKKKKGDGKNEK